MKFVAYFVLALILAACHSTATNDCSNGTCVCAAGADCSLSCAAPPCHVDCQHDSTCNGACANGECTCENGANCDFSCAAPPCHVNCLGSNPNCTGTCANGQCTCGANSSCSFECASGPCHTTCAAGSTCVVSCPAGTAGTQNCDITMCAAGDVVVCPNGLTTTCGAPCPKG